MSRLADGALGARFDGDFPRGNVLEGDAGRGSPAPPEDHCNEDTDLRGEQEQQGEGKHVTFYGVLNKHVI